MRGFLFFLSVATLACAALACEHPRPNYTGQAGVGGPGVAGTTGAAGTSGVAGVSGIAGDTGVAGTTGIAGVTGSSGTTGEAGTTGGPGTAGTTGSTGEAGTTGNAGTTGSAGTTGAAGTSGGTNLITNPDFASGANDWHVEGGGTGAVMSGQYCVSGWDGSATLVGWSSTQPAVMLSVGAQYQFSYQASASGGSAMIHVKIGLADAPYTADFEGDNTLSSSLQTFTHMFTAKNGARTGIALYPKGSSANNNRVCIDNVSLVKL